MLRAHYFPNCSNSLVGVRKGRQLKAVIPGGSSSPVLPASIMMECTMDYDSIAKRLVPCSARAVIVMDDSRSMVESLKRLSYFYMQESCGLRGTPSRALCLRYAADQTIAALASRLIWICHLLADSIQGRTTCALGDAAAMPVRAMIKHFRHEFEAYACATRSRSAGMSMSEST